jgi:hypothetical protein
MSLAAPTVMTTLVTPPAPIAGALPSVFTRLPRPATVAHRPIGWRNLAVLGGLVAAPLATGIAIARTASARRGALAGGLTALALATARLQLARWFTAEPAYQIEGRIGALELRRYGARIEAAAEVDVPVLEQALALGYGRLAGYLAGANRTTELLHRAAPVLTAMRDGRYTVAFIMPPGRTIASLPAPMHPGVELHEVPGRTIAALRFRGRFTRDNIAAHERALLEQVLDAGLAARGSVIFAAFDGPATLPILRRNELWIEVT